MTHSKTPMYLTQHEADVKIHSAEQNPHIMLVELREKEISYQRYNNTNEENLIIYS